MTFRKAIDNLFTFLVWGTALALCLAPMVL